MDAASFLAIANEGAFCVEEGLFQRRLFGDVLLGEDEFEVAFGVEFKAALEARGVFVFVGAG